MSGSKCKRKSITTYNELSRKIVSALQAKEGRLIGEFIPLEAGIYWLIGEKIVWYAEELLEGLASDLTKDSGKPWSARDLSKMSQLYFRYPTIEKFAARCVGRKPKMKLDELIDREAL